MERFTIADAHEIAETLALLSEARVELRDGVLGIVLDRFGQRAAIEGREVALEGE